MKTVGILLAGGKSRRFGSPKAFATWNDQYFYEWSYAALASICDDVIIITRAELLHLYPKNLSLTTDDQRFSGDGPLAGIFTGMKSIQAEQYIVLPCDMPLITGEELKKLTVVSSTGAIKAVKQGEIFHPLVSIWSGSLKEALYQSLMVKQFSVMQFMSTVNTEWIPANQISDKPATLFQNINKPL